MSRNAITTSTRNWLANWSRARRLLLAGIVVGAAAVACEEPREIGLPPTTPVGVFYTDTIRVVRQTVGLDSVRSSNLGSLLVGEYNDPVFGPIQARAYVQSQLASDFVVNDTATTNATPANRIIHDSTRLVLDLNGYWYGDTTRLQDIQVFRLTDSLRLQTNYDIRSTVPVESQPLARQTIRPRPSARDSVNARIALPDAYGRQILALANTDAGKVANATAFNARFLSGLMITSATPSAILGFAPGSIVGNTVYPSYIAVYYHVQGEKLRREQFLLLNGKRFNQITAQRNATAFANLGPQQTLPASATGGRTFIQPAAGVTTKLTFPGLDQLKTQGRVAINRADLVITPRQPAAGSYLPANLVLAELNAQNKILRTSPTQIIQLVPGTQTLFNRSEPSFASPQIATYNSATKTYTFELGGYLQSVAAGSTPNNGLGILTSQYSYNASGTNLLAYAGRAQDYYLSASILQAVLEGDASAKLIVFYTTSQ